MSDRLRLSEFCTMIGETVPTVRGLMVRQNAPFDPTPPEGSQRTYDGADLLAWCLFTSLRNVGLGSSVAADVVHLSGAVKAFLDAMERGENLADFHLYAHWTRRDRRHRGRPAVDRLAYLYGTSADVGASLASEAEGYGQPNLSGDTRLGTVALVAVPLLPCYDRCRATAAAHGFTMVGRDLIEVAA